MAKKMNEGEIRQLAAMYAMVAEVEAVKVKIEAMKIDNKEREENGLDMKWGGDIFRDAARGIELLAEKLREEI
jgi:hypothetical protein